MRDAFQSKVAVDDIIAGLAGLSEEFPDWTIKLVDSVAPYQAVRNDVEPLMLGAGSYTGLRALLEEVAGIVRGVGLGVRR